MKYAIALAFLFAIGAAAAADAQNPTVTALEARGHALYERATKVLQANRGSHDHLLESLNHQVTKLVELLKDLYHLAVEDVVHADQNAHKIHVIEEELLYIENRITEEILIIEDSKNNGHHQGETVDEIVAKAEKLIASAKEAVKKHPNAKEVTEINREMIVIGALVQAVQSKPNAADLAIVSQELARQEKTLKQLIEKAAARHD